MKQFYHYLKNFIFFFLLVLGFTLQAQEEVNQSYNNEFSQAFCGW